MALSSSNTQISWRSRCLSLHWKMESYHTKSTGICPQKQACKKPIADKAGRSGMKPPNVLKSCRLKGIFYAAPVARHGHPLTTCGFWNRTEVPEYPLVAKIVDAVEKPEIWCRVFLRRFAV